MYSTKQPDNEKYALQLARIIDKKHPLQFQVQLWESGVSENMFDVSVHPKKRVGKMNESENLLHYSK